MWTPLTLLALIACVRAPRRGAAPRADWSTVTFTDPTVEPGINEAGHTVVSGGMPIGNGETTALVFPVVSAFNSTAGFRLNEGVHILVGMTTAMASDMAPMSLGVVSIETDPPLGTVGFVQRLHLTNATAEVTTSVGSVSVFVDSSSNRIIATTLSAGGRLLKVTTRVQSLRPESRFTYYGRCSTPSSAPDVWSSPAGDSSIGLSHRNADEDIALLNEPAAFNATLRQQGLSSLIDALQSSDKWRNRTFGLVVSSPTLKRDMARRGVLVSSSRHASIELTITTHAAQTSSQRQWERQVAGQHHAHLQQQLAASRGRHQVWWASFWQRSHIWVSGPGALAAPTANLTERYAQARYVQAVQAGTWVPIKFNGMAFTAQLPPETATSGPSYRQWGSCNWWQNTRLAYWNMIASADWDSLATLFEYYLQMMPVRPPPKVEPRRCRAIVRTRMV